MSPVRLGTGDERNHARVIRAVFRLQQRERRGQIGHKLFAPRQHDMMRRQHRKGAPARAAARDDHRAGLGDQGVAIADAHVASGQFALVERLIGEQHRQAQRPAGRPGQFAAVRRRPLPAFRGAELLQLGGQRLQVFAKPEVGAQFGGVLPEQGQLFVERMCRLPAAPGAGRRRSAGRASGDRAVPLPGTGAATASASRMRARYVAFAHERVLHHSLKVCWAMGGRSRVLVQA